MIRYITSFCLCPSCPHFHHPWIAFPVAVDDPAVAGEWDWGMSRCRARKAVTVWVVPTVEAVAEAAVEAFVEAVAEAPFEASVEEVVEAVVDPGVCF